METLIEEFKLVALEKYDVQKRPNNNFMRMFRFFGILSFLYNKQRHEFFKLRRIY